MYKPPVGTVFKTKEEALLLKSLPYREWYMLSSNLQVLTAKGGGVTGSMIDRGYALPYVIVDASLYINTRYYKDMPLRSAIEVVNTINRVMSESGL